jgi:SAM-dependent methyltransferase
LVRKVLTVLERSLSSADFDSAFRRRSKLSYITRVDRRSIAKSHGRDWHVGTFAAEGEPAELARCLASSVADRNALILDLGCGEGCMGRRLVRALRRRILGIDFSASALDMAMARRHTGQDFVLADLHRLPLRRGVASAAFSWDALYLVSDQAKALREIARALKPGAPLIFTAYFPAESAAGNRREWSALLRRTGFDLQVWSDRTEAWRQFMRAKHTRRLTLEARILTEHGAAALPELLVSRAMLGSDGGVPFLLQRNRVWIRAERR